MSAVPNPATRRWFVKWHGVTLSLSVEEYDALKRAAVDDPQEAERLVEQLLAAEPVGQQQGAGDQGEDDE